MPHTPFDPQSYIHHLDGMDLSETEKIEFIRTLTSGWSKSKTGKKHPYYLCFTKGCACRGKSIKRDMIEGQFGALLEGLRPSPRARRAR